MPADRGLGQLEDVAEFANGQCLPVQHEQQAGPQGVAKHVEVPENGRCRLIHPSIRLERTRCHV